MSLLVCKWCEEPVRWSRFLDDHYCADCRTSDTREVSEVHSPSSAKESYDVIDKK